MEDFSSFGMNKMTVALELYGLGLPIGELDPAGSEAPSSIMQSLKGSWDNF